MATKRNKGKKVVRKPAKKAVRKPVKKVVRKPAGKAVRKPVEKVVRKPAKKAVRKPARKVVRKPVEKVVRKPAPPWAQESAIGRFCWFDMLAKDVEGAVRFYRDLFGWTTKVTPMGAMGPYTMFCADGVEFAGVAPLPMPDIPPHWLGYVGVSDIAATCDAVTANGGRILHPPTAVPNIGWFAVVGDPTGGVVAPIKLEGPPTRDLTAPPGVGVVAWNELVTPDPDTAGPFYARLFGWTAADTDMGGQRYSVFRRNDEDVAGMMKTPVGATADMGAWIVYIHVAGTDAAVAKALGLGARMVMPPFDVAGVGRLAVLSDPGGAVFALWQPEKK